MLTYAPNSFMGVNYNSPTIQGMIQQQYQSNMPFQQNIPPNIGGIGYNQNPFLSYMNSPQYNNMMNGGYYSGYYQYDPQYIRQQMEEQRKAEENRLRNDIEIQKMKARIFNTFNGIETDEDYLEEMFNPNLYADINKDLNDFEEMRRLSDISNDPTRRLDNIPSPAANAIARISQGIRSNHPVTQSFEEFMETAGDLYREALINDHARELRKNIANTYDREAYNQLANLHRSSFASLRENLSVDDLSISLPQNLRGNKEYQERKNRFLSFITQNDVRNRGGGNG